jgi:RNA polymerase sigma factor (sigma-70 family)
MDGDAAGADDWSAAHDPLADEAPAAAHPERDAESAELRRLVVEFRAGLDERERTVFALRFDEQLAHPEIAARSGLSRRTRRSRRRRHASGRSCCASCGGTAT